MIGIVPKPNDRFGQVVFVAQDAQAGRAEEDIATGLGWQVEPAGGPHAQEMAAREKQNVFRRRSQAAENTVGANADLLASFTSGTAVTRQLPVVTLVDNFRGAK